MVGPASFFLSAVDEAYFSSASSSPPFLAFLSLFRRYVLPVRMVFDPSFSLAHRNFCRY